MIFSSKWDVFPLSSLITRHYCTGAPASNKKRCASANARGQVGKATPDAIMRGKTWCPAAILHLRKLHKCCFEDCTGHHVASQATDGCLLRNCLDDRLRMAGMTQKWNINKRGKMIFICHHFVFKHPKIAGR